MGFTTGELQVQYMQKHFIAHIFGKNGLGSPGSLIQSVFNILT